MNAAPPPRLAIDGGEPVRRRAWPAWPRYEADEIQAVQRVLASGKVNYWTGEEARQFEREYAAYVGRRHGIALMNGTVALELALYALGIGPGDDVVTSCRTYIASASCVVMRGARPVLADVDPTSGNVTAATLEAALTPRTRAIIVVHLGGWPCEMDDITDLARRRGLFLLEDCAQAHGATYRGRPVGSFGDAAAFSFCQDKIISTGGEGGMLLLDDEALWRRAWAYKDHGKSYAAVYERSHPPGFRWLHESFGTNWRMTELQAAIGRLQLAKLDGWIAERRRNATSLEAGLRALPGLRLTPPPAHIGHAYYRYYCYLERTAREVGWDQGRVIEAVTAEGVPCFSGSCSEIYRERAFAAGGLAPAQPLPGAQELGQSALAFLVHPGVEAGEVEDVVGAVGKVIAGANRPPP